MYNYNSLLIYVDGCGGWVVYIVASIQGHFDVWQELVNHKDLYLTHHPISQGWASSVLFSYFINTCTCTCIIIVINTCTCTCIIIVINTCTCTCIIIVIIVTIIITRIL